MTTVYLAPDPINSTQFIPGGNTPAAGAKLFCYVQGTSNKQNMYTDSLASATWTNPLILDSGGNLGGSNEIWIPAGLPAKFVLAPSNDQDPPLSPYWTRDNISGVNDPTGFTEWVPSGLVPTFVSTTSFTLTGDQTAVFTPGRRIKTTNTGGTVYSTIGTSVFGAVTTITVINDSGVLDVGLSTVSYGIISSINQSYSGPLFYNVIRDPSAVNSTSFIDTPVRVLINRGLGLTGPVASLTIGGTAGQWDGPGIRMGADNVRDWGIRTEANGSWTVHDLDANSGTGAIWLGIQSSSGSFFLPGAGPHVIGTSAAIGQVQLSQTGSFAGAAGSAQGYALLTTFTPIAGADAYGINVSPVHTIASSGTHPDFTSILVTAANVSTTGGALTNATGIKIAGAPSAGNKRRSLWVVAGQITFNGVPNSSTGLASGDLFTSSSGALMVVP
jgi:hypothetical protein